MPDYYPIFLNLSGKTCLVVGGGRVAADKVSKLRGTGALIRVVSPEITSEIREAVNQGEVEWCPREYKPGDLSDVFLGIAATDVRSVNQQVSEEAERLGVLINVVDDPSQCGFISPAIVRRGPVTLAISTGGASPALARKLRETLSTSPALEWADLAGVLSEVRCQVRRSGAAVDPQRWQCAMKHELIELARSNKEDDAVALLLGDLLEEGRQGLCPIINRCESEGCSSKVLGVAPPSDNPASP
jgi:siroheme synthase-like protein